MRFSIPMSEWARWTPWYYTRDVWTVCKCSTLYNSWNWDFVKHISEDNPSDCERKKGVHEEESVEIHNPTTPYDDGYKQGDSDFPKTTSSQEATPISLENGTRLFECELCIFQTNTVGDLHSHVQTHNFTVNCEKCDFTANTDFALELHVQSELSFYLKTSLTTVLAATIFTHSGLTYKLSGSGHQSFVYCILIEWAKIVRCAERFWAYLAVPRK